MILLNQNIIFLTVEEPDNTSLRYKPSSLY